MFGQFKPIPFDPYARSRSRWRLPRWLVLLLAGVAIGVAAVILVQERYLPPRLSSGESAKLRAAFEQTDAERARLKSQLEESTKKLDTALADSKAAASELESSRASTVRLREDLNAAVASLPPDPRGGSVEVRAAQFAASGGMLAYDVVLTRPRGATKPVIGVMQLVLAGDGARGAETTVNLQPVPVSVTSHEVLRGRLPLPEGFKPRQATIQILDRVAGKALGMRVILVK